MLRWLYKQYFDRRKLILRTETFCSAGAISGSIVLMQWIILIYVTFLGLAFGSFALAMTDRMKSGRDWVKGRSECEDCKHKLSAVDLVPVVSWLSTGGKCRYCRVRLSVYYPLVELLGGVLFALSYLRFKSELSGAPTVMLGLWLLGVVIMLSLIVFDLRWFLLPSKLVYPLIATALLHWAIGFSIGGVSAESYLLSGVLSILVGSGIFWGLWVVSRGKWIGDGDYRLGVAIGLFLNSPVLAWLSLFVASIFGLIAAAPVYLKHKNKMKAKIPFGPFLILGLVVAYLYGQVMVDWYSRSFLYL